MTATIRKQILDKMQTAALLAPSLSGRVFRSRTAALARGESPALIIRRADEAVESLGDMAQRDFVVSFLYIARGDVADDIADATAAEVHALLCVDVSFGGLAGQLFEESSHWTYASADGDACELETRYRVRYMTPEQSLTDPPQ